MAAVNWTQIRPRDCELSVKVKNLIAKHLGVEATLGQISEMPIEDAVQAFGRKGYREVMELLKMSQASFPVKPPAPPPFLPTASTDWALLGRAVEFYKSKGFCYVEAPWAVTEEAVAITCPNPQFTARVDGLGSLVGSAEQSMLHLLTDVHLPPVDAEAPYYVACTPCFRLGDVEDGLHFPYFMKVELFTPFTNILAMLHFLNYAGECFRELGATPDMLKTEQTDQGVDILVNGIEVGSYGMRNHQCADGQEITWTYGTGLALPRFSQALVA